MAARSSHKVVGRLTQSQYGVLNALTHDGPVDKEVLGEAVRRVVSDRVAFARGLIGTAKILRDSQHELVRRTAASRAYYAAYHAARAVVFDIHSRDEDDHERLPRLIDEALPAEALGETLKELRRLRNEVDYSPYPGPDGRTRYDDGELEALVVDSVEQAERVVTMLAAYVERRARTS